MTHGTSSAFSAGIILLMISSVFAHPGHFHSTTFVAAHNIPNQVEMKVQGEYRVITSNGIPDHVPGQFPRKGNPNRISAQQHQFRVPLHPKEAYQIKPIGMNAFGVAINGVPFDPAAAEWWQRNPRSGWQYEALSGKVNLGMDYHNAHVQPNGAYHYHGIPTGMVEMEEENRMQLIGYAADGFPIYSQLGYKSPTDAGSSIIKVSPSYQVKKGQRPSGPRGQYDGTFVEDYEYVARSGDLDECNGRFGVTPEYPEGIYHYYITDEFPFIPRYFRGTPDDSFQKRPPHGGPPGGRGRPMGPPPGGGRPPFPPPGGRPPGR